MLNHNFYHENCPFSRNIKGRKSINFYDVASNSAYLKRNRTVNLAVLRGNSLPMLDRAYSLQKEIVINDSEKD